MALVNVKFKLREKLIERNIFIFLFKLYFFKHQLCCLLRFFRMNIRCRIINYVRERLPVMDFQKRIQILNDLKKATSFMQMLPLLGCGFLTFVDYPVDRCIFKGGNGCCALANATKNLQRGSIAGAVNSRFAVQFAMSDLSIFTWKSSSAYNLINEKPRMRYTNSFMK